LGKLQVNKAIEIGNALMVKIELRNLKELLSFKTKNRGDKS